MASCPSDHWFSCCLFLLILQSFLHFLPFCVAIMIRSSNRHELLCSRGNLAWSWGFRCTSLDQSVAARCRPPPFFAFQHVLQLFQTGLANWRILVVVILACSHSPQPHVQLRVPPPQANISFCSELLDRLDSCLGSGGAGIWSSFNSPCLPSSSHSGVSFPFSASLHWG